MTDILNFLTLIIVSCLHLGQNSGKFSSIVSTPILTLVLLPQTGHNIQSYSLTLPSPLVNVLLDVLLNALLDILVDQYDFNSCKH